MAVSAATTEQELLNVPAYPGDAEFPENLWLDGCWGN
jgi:hypothetical protein